jgi:chemotaxis protein CheD
MLSMLAQSPLTGIGARNVAVITAGLQSSGVPLVAADFGGQVGRTLILSVATGQVHVRTSTGATQDL